MRVLHISEPMVGSPVPLKDEAASKRVRDGIKKAFLELSLFLRSGSVDILLISGGLFDNRYLTPEHAGLILREIALCPSCRVVVSPGKSDRLLKTGFYLSYPLPDNMFVFKSSEPSFFEFPELNTRVYGYAVDSLSEENADIELPEPDPNFINLFMCPATPKAKEGGSRSAFFEQPERLEKLGKFDYIAIGASDGKGGVGRTNIPGNSDGVSGTGVTDDIDGTGSIGSIGEAHYGAPGSLFGRGFFQTGRRYGILFDIEKPAEPGKKKSFKAEKIGFSKIHFEDDRIDISGAKTGEEIRKAIISHVIEKKYGRSTALRITLIGSIESSLIPEPERYEKDLSDILLYTEIRDRTLPEKSGFKTISDALNSKSEAERRKAALAHRLILSAKSGTRQNKET